jgi:hypothetical protein
MSPLQHTSAHCCCDNRKMEEMHWEILIHHPYKPDLVASNFHLFIPLKEALGGKRFKAIDEVKLFVQ